MRRTVHQWLLNYWNGVACLVTLGVDRIRGEGPPTVTLSLSVRSKNTLAECSGVLVDVVAVVGKIRCPVDDLKADVKSFGISRLLPEVEETTHPMKPVVDRSSRRLELLGNLVLIDRIEDIENRERRSIRVELALDVELPKGGDGL